MMTDNDSAQTDSAHESRHDETWVFGGTRIRAVLAQAAAFDVLAVAIPEQRADAVRLRMVGPLFKRAITVRDWVEETE